MPKNNTDEKIIKCPRCGKEPAIIDSSFGVLPGAKCQRDDERIVVGERPRILNISKQHRIQEQRDKHGRDILQPYAPGKDMNPNPDFVKAYPDKAKDYFSDEQLTKM
jgi:hypothetical protein